MFDSPRWVKRAMSRIGSPRSPLVVDRSSNTHRDDDDDDVMSIGEMEQDDDFPLHPPWHPAFDNSDDDAEEEEEPAARPLMIGFVESTEQAWADFSVSPQIRQLLSGAPSDLFPSSPRYRVVSWLAELQTAYRLVTDLQREARTNNDAGLDIAEYFHLLSILVKGAYYEEHGLLERLGHEESHHFLLHATIGLVTSPPTPSAFLDAVLERYPEQLRQPNPVDHQLPLTTVAIRGGTSCLGGTNQLYPRILAADPTAANLPNTAGEYPLHFACRDSNMEWSTGLEALVQAAPSTLHRIHPASGTSVFALTAIARAPRTTTEAVNTQFELLRHFPEVLRAHIQD